MLIKHSWTLHYPSIENPEQMLAKEGLSSSGECVKHAKKIMEAFKLFGKPEPAFEAFRFVYTGDKPEWKNTLNIDCGANAGIHIDDFAREAERVGYPFFTHNGRVYQTDRVHFESIGLVDDLL